MKAFLTFVLLLLAGWWLLPALLRGILRYLVRRVAQDHARREADFQRQHRDTPFGKTVYTRDGLTVVVPAHAPPKNTIPDLKDVAQPIDFEEIRGE